MATVPLSQAKTHLAKLLTDVEALGEEVIETLEILADQDLAKSIEQGLAETEAGEVLKHEDFTASLRSRR